MTINWPKNDPKITLKSKTTVKWSLRPLQSDPRMTLKSKMTPLTSLRQWRNLEQKVWHLGSRCVFLVNVWGGACFGCFCRWLWGQSSVVSMCRRSSTSEHTICSANHYKRQGPVATETILPHPIIILHIKAPSTYLRWLGCVWFVFVNG